MNCKKDEFSLDPELTYLNCAYMSPLMKTVQDAGIKGIERKINPSKVLAEDFFNESEILRKEFAELIDCKEPERIVIIPSVSYGMANIAKNLSLSSAENIVIIGEQFPSNVYPWMEVAQRTGAAIRTVSAPELEEERGKVWNETILEAIDERTKLVACSHIHWADGTLFDLKVIREKTFQTGALLVIDGTQSMGAMPFSIEEIQPDALVAAGYKSLMGPYSIGLAYYGPAFGNGSPIEQNWINRFESENFANLVNYNDRYQPGALRYEVGEHSNFILVPMMLEAVRKLNEWGSGNIKNYLDELVRNPLAELRSHEFKVEEEAYRASNLFGIRLGENHNMEEIKRKLTEKNVFVSYRGDAIRISPNVYNDSEDLITLTRVLTS